MTKSSLTEHGERNAALKTDTLYDPALADDDLLPAGHEHIIRAKTPEDRKPHKALAQEGKQQIVGK
jgi:hypothetical protein